MYRMSQEDTPIAISHDKIMKIIKLPINLFI